MVGFAAATRLDDGAKMGNRGAIAPGKDHAYIDDGQCHRARRGAGGDRFARGGAGATGEPAPPPAAADRNFAAAIGSAMRGLACGRAPGDRRHRGAADALLVGIALKMGRLVAVECRKNVVMATCDNFATVKSQSETISDEPR